MPEFGDSETGKSEEQVELTEMQPNANVAA
jgi:hypothetical protein